MKASEKLAKLQQAKNHLNQARAALYDAEAAVVEASGLEESNVTHRLRQAQDAITHAFANLAGEQRKVSA